VEPPAPQEEDRKASRHGRRLITETEGICQQEEGGEHGVVTKFKLKLDVAASSRYWQQEENVVTAQERKTTLMKTAAGGCGEWRRDL
jgi:hypothetical protein